MEAYRESLWDRATAESHLSGQEELEPLGTSATCSSLTEIQHPAADGTWVSQLSLQQDTTMRLVAS